ncbi:zinc ribbon domain-containing protein [Candidatus Bathyarchaeota archaeon]|nr:MAG: zinc ribbon domain-containing protein [Candidatus Bathyarchaeota archaeon]
MTGMHVHQPISVTAQTPLGQAMQSASTMGLLLLVPPQPQETCPLCGHVQSAGWRFCSNCGTRLRCPSCSTQSLGKNYCHNCGTRLRS